MDSPEENISLKDMLEQIAELDYSQSQLKELNAEMRHWLDIADDDMAVLRSENTNLKKQIKDLEKILTELQQAEVEPCGPLLADGLDEKKVYAKKIQDLERETLKVQEENKELTAQLKSLKHERDQDKISMVKLRADLENIEIGMEEVHLELLRREELIDQKNQQLKHLEETVEEYSDIIKDLRLTKQELSNQLEDRRDQASLAAVTEAMREEEEEEGQPSPHLSIAEEIHLLFSAKIKTCTMGPQGSASGTSELDKNVEPDADEQLEPHSLTADLRTRSGNSFAASLRTSIQLLLMSISFCILASVVFGCWVINTDSLLMVPPYVSVQFKALPPI